MELETIPMIVGIIEAVKIAIRAKFGEEGVKKYNGYVPLIAIALGVAVNYTVEFSWALNFWLGITVGLASMGLYDTAKPVAGKVLPTVKTAWTDMLKK